jgi:hypothetical protein
VVLGRARVVILLIAAVVCTLSHPIDPNLFLCVTPGCFLVVPLLARSLKGALVNVVSLGFV